MTEYLQSVTPDTKKEDKDLCVCVRRTFSCRRHLVSCYVYPDLVVEAGDMRRLSRSAMPRCHDASRMILHAFQLLRFRLQNRTGCVDAS
jgi:hypothetical protein